LRLVISLQVMGPETSIDPSGFDDSLCDWPKAPFLNWDAVVVMSDIVHLNALRLPGSGIAMVQSLSWSLTWVVRTTECKTSASLPVVGPEEEDHRTHTRTESSVPGPTGAACPFTDGRKTDVRYHSLGDGALRTQLRPRARCHARKTTVLGSEGDTRKPSSAPSIWAPWEAKKTSVKKEC
jgi:hypothetical protein